MTINEIFNNKWIGNVLSDIEVVRPFVKRKHSSPKKEYKRLHRLVRRIYKAVLLNPKKLYNGVIGKWYGVRVIEN